jgi:ATP-dependent Clp protease ATP-binding subunit ClpA
LATLTPRARSVLVFAQEEAHALNHPYLGTEHLLLGIPREQDGLGAQALAHLGVTLAPVRAAVRRIVGQGSQGTEGALCFTPRSKRALERARQEAKRLRHPYVGSEHLLLGLLQDRAGIAAGILTELGVTDDQAEAEIRRLLAQAGVAGDADAGTSATTVVMSRLGAADLQLLDMLVEAGVRSTRSDAAAWLIHAGIEANRPMFAAIAETVAEIHRLRARAFDLAQQAQTRQPTPPPS